MIRGRWWASLRSGSVTVDVLERLRVLVVAGAVTGFVVIGIGSRLAMLSLRWLSPDRQQDALQGHGFTIGHVTSGGTYNLLLLGAAFGIIGAAAYRAVAPWLVGPQWLRRATTAAGSAAVAGSLLVHADGVDFTQLKPAWLAVTLFIALPAVFGAVIGPVVDGVASVGSWTAQGRRQWVLPVALSVLLPSTIVASAMAAAVLFVWVPLRRLLTRGAGVPTPVGVALRGASVALALAGVFTVLADVEAVMG